MVRHHIPFEIKICCKRINLAEKKLSCRKKLRSQLLIVSKGYVTHGQIECKEDVVWTVGRRGMITWLVELIWWFMNKGDYHGELYNLVSYIIAGSCFHDRSV